MSGSSAIGIAAQPSIERPDVVIATSLGHFFFGLRDRIADAAPLEFGSERVDLAPEDRRPPRPLHRSGVGERGLPSLRQPLDQREATVDERVPFVLLRCPELCDRGLDTLDIDVKAALFHVPRDFERERVMRSALRHGRLPRQIGVGGLAGFPAAVMTAPTRSVASFNGSRNKCAYLCVVAGLLCPSSAPISGSDAPPLTNCEA